MSIYVCSGICFTPAGLVGGELKQKVVDRVEGVLGGDDATAAGAEHPARRRGRASLSLPQGRVSLQARGTGKTSRRQDAETEHPTLDRLRGKLGRERTREKERGLVPRQHAGAEGSARGSDGRLQTRLPRNGGTASVARPRLLREKRSLAESPEETQHGHQSLQQLPHHHEQPGRALLPGSSPREVVLPARRNGPPAGEQPRQSRL